jgi:DNA-binding transcriptional regulator GbsR (MarR family)
MPHKKEKEELIEMFGIHFENNHNLPPLGARILATLILDGCRTGITFEDLVERLGASKSSISTNLNLLLKIGKINYYTLPGDRKKYFKPSPFSERLNGYMRMLAFEKEIIDRMVEYRQKTASSREEEINLENVKAYKDHVIEVEQLLAKTIEKFKEIEKKKSEYLNNNNNINQNNQ